MIAVIGAGFAGLAAAYYLSKDHKVTVFDQTGIGGGASGVSSGLLHPYPGEKGRRSWKADEAMAAARELLKVSEEALGKKVAHYGGILRQGEILTLGDDVEQLGPDEYIIHSGITVYTELYLQGLWKACEKRGVELVIQKITSLPEGFDRTILAVGAGIKAFAHPFNLNFVKGQVLTCRLDHPLERSISSKRYTALTQFSDRCHIGATYERDFMDDNPDLKTAVRLLQPETEVFGCRAGIRVTNRAHYFPILEKLNPTTWAITALGSRGLLYHAYLAKLLEK